MNISIINPILKEQINEITNNKNPLIPFEVKKKGNDEYFITISLEPTIIANSPFDSKQNYEFLIYIQKNYPYNPPRLYCITDFQFKCRKSLIHNPAGFNHCFKVAEGCNNFFCWKRHPS